MRQPEPVVPAAQPPAIPPGAALAHGCCGGGVKLAVPGPAAAGRSSRAAPPTGQNVPGERP